MTNKEIVKAAEDKLLTTTITGKTYAGRLAAGVPAKAWDDAFALLAQVQDAPVAPPPPPDSVPVPGVDVNGRWYAPDSPWNTPIVANPKISPDNAAQIQWMVANSVGAFGPQINNTSIYIANNATPKVRVIVNYPTCDARSTDAGTMVPIPTGALPGGAGMLGSNELERSMVVVNSDTGEEWGMFKLTPPNVTPLVSGPVCAAKPLWACTVLYHDTAGWKGSGNGYSYRASRTLGGAGAIRLRDTKLPAGSTWDHAIAMAYPHTRSGSFVAPATATDGKYPDAASIPMGARIQLDPAYDVNASSLPEWQKQLCRTIQKYGIIIVDTGDGLLNEGYASVFQSGYKWPWEPNWIPLPASVVARFRVVYP